MTKGKPLAVLLKAGPLTTLATMAVAAWVYAWIFGAPLAAGLVLMVLLHELGHGLAARRQGLKVSAPIFIPFVGAVLVLQEQPRSAWADVLIGAGGPAAGLTGAAVALAAGLALPEGHGRDLLLVLAWLTALLNFFNLTPLPGLDGGRITRHFLPRDWLSGLLFLAAVALACAWLYGTFNPFVFLILLPGAWRALYGWWRAREATGARRLLDRLSALPAEDAPVVPALEAGQRVRAVGGYFALAGLLYLLISSAAEVLPPFAELNAQLVK